jgi:hypothetical protein
MVLEAFKNRKYPGKLPNEELPATKAYDQLAINRIGVRRLNKGGHPEHAEG